MRAVRRYGAATSRISGRATPTGTSAYCERTNVPLSSMLKPTGWEIGAVGIVHAQLRVLKSFVAVLYRILVIKEISFCSFL